MGNLADLNCRTFYLISLLVRTVALGGLLTPFQFPPTYPLAILYPIGIPCGCFTGQLGLLAQVYLGQLAKLLGRESTYGPVGSVSSLLGISQLMGFWETYWGTFSGLVMWVAERTYLIMGFSCRSCCFLMLSQQFIWEVGLTLQQEYFLPVQGRGSFLPLLKVTVVVVLLLETGVYLGETEPAPREEDRALGLGSTELMPYTSLRYSSTVTFLLSSMAVETSRSQVVSCSGLWNSLTTSCCKISSIVMRFLGLKMSMRVSRSAQAGEKSFRKAEGFEVFGAFISLISDREISDSSEAMSSSEGYPVKTQIFSIWSMVQLPGKRGF